MEPKAYVLIFGSLGLCIAAIVAGSYIGAGLGHALLALGIIGGIMWIVGAFWLANAMNSDI